MTTAFFHRDGDWLVGNDGARGPWSADACHAGPVTGALAAAAEALVRDKTLTRLTANYWRPIPMDGFRLDAQIFREGRTSTLANVALHDRDGRLSASAECLFLATAPNELPSASIDAPVFEDSEAGQFPVDKTRHDKKFFGHCIDIRYPPGEDGSPGPTTLWMRTPSIVEGDTMTSFQSLCPLADCGNDISRNTEITQASCINADLTISVFRQPRSDWLAARTISFWETDGIGMSHAMLFDKIGAIGTALQSLIVRASS